MNLNEQLQQAYEAGRQEGLNEQGRFGPFRDISFPDRPGGGAGGGGGGMGPNKPPGDGGGVNPTPRDPKGRGIDASGWIFAVDAGIPPSWWELPGGTWSQFYQAMRRLTLNAQKNLPLRPPINMGEFWALFMRALYDADNKLAWGEVMKHPFIAHLGRQGWFFEVDDSGRLLFNHDSETFGQITDIGPITLWAMNLQSLLNTYPFPPNP